MTAADQWTLALLVVVLIINGIAAIKHLHNYILGLREDDLAGPATALTLKKEVEKHQMASDHVREELAKELKNNLTERTNYLLLEVREVKGRLNEAVQEFNDRLDDIKKSVQYIENLERIRIETLESIRSKVKE